MRRFWLKRLVGFLTVLKWLIIGWAIYAIAVVVGSVVMFRLHWFPFGLSPHTRNFQDDALFLAGPALAAAAHYLMEKMFIKKGNSDFPLSTLNRGRVPEPESVVLKASVLAVAVLAWLILNWLSAS